MNVYYVMRNSEDGIRIDSVDEAELLDRLKVQDGATYWGRDIEFREDPPDAYTPENELFILRGEVVLPKPAEVVQTYSL